MRHRQKESKRKRWGIKEAIAEQLRLFLAFRACESLAHGWGAPEEPPAYIWEALEPPV